MSGEQVAIVGVVTIGKFNPSIAHPSWLASEGLITKAEAEGAKIEVIHPEVAEFTVPFSAGATVRVQVLRERLHVWTEDARLYETTRDLSISILTLLRHTPVSKLGINFDCHTSMADDEARNALGRRLAPPTPWGGIIDQAALLSLSMKCPRTDGRAGHIVVKVEPSDRVSSGVLVAVNDHVEVVSPDGHGAEKVVELLKSSWDTSIKRSREIVAKVTK
jgi:hypothetical protein